LNALHHLFLNSFLSFIALPNSQAIAFTGAAPLAAARSSYASPAAVCVRGRRAQRGCKQLDRADGFVDRGPATAADIRADQAVEPTTTSGFEAF